MLTLFPFEASYYERQSLPVTFVGHPLADQIGEKIDCAGVRARLGLPADGIIIALLPGSRINELRKHAALFVQTALWLHRRNRSLRFVVPLVNSDIREMFEQALEKNKAGQLPMVMLDGQSRDAMAAANVVVLASGTAALEAALLQRLMIVTYKVSFITYVLVKMFAHIKLFSLPNNLLGRELVPELIQDDAAPEKLGAAVEDYLNNPEKAQAVIAELRKIGTQLRRNANDRAAEAVLRMLQMRAAPT